MATDTDLVNKALALIGQERITSLDNTVNSKVIQTANLFLEPSKRATMRAYDWNCCRKRAPLVETSTNAAEGEWLYSYALPSDCLAARRFAGDKNRRFKFSIERTTEPGINRVIYANIKTPTLVYTSSSFNDVNQWDALLFDACAHRLAIDFASVFPRDLKFVEAMWKGYQLKIAEAAGMNEAEDGIEDQRSQNMINVRF